MFLIRNSYFRYDISKCTNIKFQMSNEFARDLIIIFENLIRGLKYMITQIF